MAACGDADLRRETTTPPTPAMTARSAIGTCAQAVTTVLGSVTGTDSPNIVVTRKLPLTSLILSRSSDEVSEMAKQAGIDALASLATFGENARGTRG